MCSSPGRIDASLDPVVSVWDIAALKVIVEEAGGASPTWRETSAWMEAAQSRATASCTRTCSPGSRGIRQLSHAEDGLRPHLGGHLDRACEGLAASGQQVGRRLLCGRLDPLEDGVGVGLDLDWCEEAGDRVGCLEPVAGDEENDAVGGAEGALAHSFA